MLIKVKCYPKSKKELLNKKDENSFEIFLKEKPERGGANKRKMCIRDRVFCS